MPQDPHIETVKLRNIYSYFWQKFRRSIDTQRVRTSEVLCMRHAWHHMTSLPATRDPDRHTRGPPKIVANSIRAFYAYSEEAAVSCQDKLAVNQRKIAYAPRKYSQIKEIVFRVLIAKFVYIHMIITDKMIRRLCEALVSQINPRTQ